MAWAFCAFAGWSAKPGQPTMGMPTDKDLGAHGQQLSRLWGTPKNVMIHHHVPFDRQVWQWDIKIVPGTDGNTLFSCGKFVAFGISKIGISYDIHRVILGYPLWTCADLFSTLWPEKHDLVLPTAYYFNIVKVWVKWGFEPQNMVIRTWLIMGVSKQKKIMRLWRRETVPGFHSKKELKQAEFDHFDALFNRWSDRHWPIPFLSEATNGQGTSVVVRVNPQYWFDYPSWYGN